MKRFFALLFYGLTIVFPTVAESAQRLDWAVILHGGAGSLRRDADPGHIDACRRGLEDALSIGKDMLSKGRPSLEVVEAVVKNLEDNPVFNAGRGAVFNHDGEHELDASIMNGRTLACGAVGGVRTVKNPIGLARLVMENTRHILLAGPGADKFAAEMGVRQVEQSYFSTPRRRKQLDEFLEKEKNPQGSLQQGAKEFVYGTVGCVAMDREGNIAAATSTGGLTGKKFGRIGDSPIITAGTYADNRTCGISGTGIGEQFIRHAVAFQISSLIDQRGMSLDEAAQFVMHKRLKKGDGGVIGVDRNGRTSSVFTTPAMLRAAADSNGRSEVKMWK